VKLVFDIETNGFLENMDKIFSLVIHNVDTNELFSYKPDEIEKGLHQLLEADEIIGHNIMQFDIPALQKVYPWFVFKKKIFDTLIVSRLIWSDLKELDFKKRTVPNKLIGSHSLKAWGYRIGDHKDEFGETTDWGEWSQEMQDYCEQDVKLTSKFYQLILRKKYSQQAIELEHEFAECIHKQEKLGFCFDVDKAKELHTLLNTKRVQLLEELQKIFPPWKKVVGVLIPKRDNKTRGYKKGVPVKKIKEIMFNAGSRDHIADRLMTLKGWKPKEFTPDGKPKVDEKVLEKLLYPEAKLLSEYLLIQKRLGMLAEGDNAWIKLEKRGKIYGKVITNGTATGRCTHHSPNIGQVCSASAKYGKEFRSLFIVPSGYKLVGCDVSGLELRCLSSYLTRWDFGAYRKELLEGDIHTANQLASGVPTRDKAKTFIYAFLYGAGDKKIGEIVKGTAKEGKHLKETFLRKTPAIKKLRETVIQNYNERGFLYAIDRRRIHPRSEHSALNFLLQSCGSIIVKKATILLHKNLSHLKYGEDWGMVAHIHDEVQLQVREELADEVGKIAVQSIQQTQSHFKFNCELDGEYKIGNNWAETH